MTVTLKKLGDVAEFIRGITFTPNDVVGDLSKSNIGVMRTKNVQQFLDLTDVWGIDKSFVKNNKQYLSEGDLLVSSANSWNLVGKVAWVPKLDYEATFGGFVTVLRANENIVNKRYLYYWFASEKTQALLRSFANKTTNISNLNLKRALDLKIPIPPFAEQIRIAKLLDTADNVLQLRKQAIEKLDEISKSIFKNYLSKSENLESIKKLGEICDVRDGTHASPKYVTDGVPLVTSKNLKNGFVDLSDVSLISIDDFFEINKRSKVDCGDILMPMIGTIGNPVVVEEENPMYAIKNVALLKQRPCSPSPIYLKAFLESDNFEIYVAKVSRGGTQKFLGLGDIRALKIPLLKKDIENQFLEMSKEINSLRKKYIAYSLRIDAVVSSLQHQSFAVN